jgi:hypothetical protein
MATATAQGLEMGAVYRVVEVVERSTFAGNFVTYVVELEGGGRVSVGNGHMVLTEVEEAQVCEHCEEYLKVPTEVYCIGCLEAFREIEADNIRIDAERRDREVAEINTRLGLGKAVFVAVEPFDDDEGEVVVSALGADRAKVHAAAFAPSDRGQYVDPEFITLTVEQASQPQLRVGAILRQRDLKVVGFAGPEGEVRL